MEGEELNIIELDMHRREPQQDLVAVRANNPRKDDDKHA